MLDNRLPLLTAAILSTALLAGCDSNGDDDAMDTDDQVELDEQMEHAEDEAEKLVGEGMEMLEKGELAMLDDARPGQVIYETEGYAEVVSMDGKRLLVVDPTGKDLMEVAEDGDVGGEDFKMIGRSSPVGMTVLGEPDLQDKFKARWSM
jgi:hypothetical protein